MVKGNYNNNFSKMVEDHFGTLKQFKDQMGISHVTAIRYLRNPGTMRVDFAQKIATEMKVDVCRVIGEGEE